MDELTQAVERRRTNNYAPITDPHVYSKRDVDAGILADAYLAHLADDKRREEERSQPVTEEFEDAIWPDSEVCTEWHDDWGTAITWLDRYGSVSIPMPKTRGQLLDLLSGLGINVKERGK